MYTDNILKIKEKILAMHNKDKLNEEQTKTSLIMPIFMALGYDIFNIDEFIPEYVADFGTKQGEKVDYAICINGQPMILIEAKKIGVNLGKEQVSQLFRYYASTDAKIAILTNGDDYWFFTDSIKANQMDTEPYLKIKISELSDSNMEALNNYTIENIENIDIASGVKIEKVRAFISEFIDGIYTGNINRQFIEWIMAQSGADDIEKTKVASIFDDKLTQKFGISRKDKEDTMTENTVSDKPEKTKWARDKSRASDIVIGREYTFNEVNWAFHKPDYIRLFGNKYEAKSFKIILVKTLEILCSNNKVLEDKLIQSDIKLVNTEFPENWRGILDVPGTKIKVGTHMGAEGFSDLLVKILDMADIKHEELKICFEK